MSTVLKNRWRGGVALLAFLLLISFGITEGIAQSRNRKKNPNQNQKRITSLQNGQGAEGARVTIVADSALNDYEAFRRGDRFYVRIPLANFTAAQPGFRGDGFEDVQVEKVGDSVVASFKLQPGATARVDQRSNRLQVLFSAPNGMARHNTPNSAPSRVSSSATTVPIGTNSDSTLQERERDADRPIPSRSPQISGENVERPNDGQSTSSRSAQAGTELATKAGDNPSTSSGEPLQVDSSDPVASAASPGYAMPTIVTPAVTEPSSAPRTAGKSNWKTRGLIAVQWVSANRLVSLLGALALLTLIGLLAVFVNSRRRNVAKAKRVKTLGVRPTYRPALESEGMVAGRASDSVSNMDSVLLVDEVATRRPGKQPSSPSRVVHPDFSRARVGGTIDRALAAAVVAKPPSQGTLTRPPKGPSISVVGEVSEAQEREVFEL